MRSAVAKKEKAQKWQSVSIISPLDYPFYICVCSVLNIREPKQSLYEMPHKLEWLYIVTIIFTIWGMGGGAEEDFFLV